MTVTKKVYRLALPIILSNLSVPLIGAVDTAVVGHLNNAALIGAVAVGSLIFDYLYWGFSFLRLSTTGLVAQAYGKDDGSLARAVALRALVLALIAGLALWTLQSPIIWGAQELLGASPAVEAGARRYFDILIWAAPMVLVNYVLIGWMLALQDTRAVLVMTLVMNILNVVLDLVFVIGLGMDVDGVALASLISVTLGCGLGMLMMKTTLNRLPGEWNVSALKDWLAIKAMLLMGGDLMIRTVCLLSAFAWFTNQGAKMGDVVLAANAILLHFQNIMAYGLDGFANAAETLVGNAIGKKDGKAFDQAVKTSTQAALGIALGFSLIYWGFGETIIALFTDLEAVKALCATYLIWTIISPLISVWSFQLDGIFFGATWTKDLRNMMVLSLVGYIALGTLLVDQFANHGLWLAFLSFLALRGLTLGLRMAPLRRATFG